MACRNTTSDEDNLIESAEMLGLDSLVEIIKRLDLELYYAQEARDSLFDVLSDVKEELDTVKDKLALYEEEDE